MTLPTRMLLIAAVAALPAAGGAQQKAPAKADTAKKAAAPAHDMSKMAGDTGMKIATAHKISVKDLQAVNPDVDFNRLKVGQKISASYEEPQEFNPALGYDIIEVTVTP